MQQQIPFLKAMASRLRRHSLVSTSEAGSGHPTSCLSCADLISAIFFHFLRFQVEQPHNPHNDRFVLSKGHAAPILWAAWAEAGAFPPEQLHTLRRLDSDLEGHPTPRSPWVDVATGSLGQGLSIAVGMALASQLSELGNRIFVLLGDGEVAEGAVWEAAALASHRRLDNLIAVVDVNRLGQSQATMHGHDVDCYARRFRSFGWRTEVIDGHDMAQILSVLESATSSPGAPVAIIAKTLKGKGVSFLEDRDGWHGKPVPQGEELERALGEIEDHPDRLRSLRVAPAVGVAQPKARPQIAVMDPPHFPADEPVATRWAYGIGLQKLGRVCPEVMVLDGDTKNSTYSEFFLKEFPDRFVECFIAEQNMVGAAVGVAAMGKVAFASTFACFLTRAYDFIRMAAISQVNLTLCGSHAGVSIGQDGPSQMGLEDLAMMRAITGSTVLYPSDAVCAERMVALAAQATGLVYIRTSRPKTAILYDAGEEFSIGGSKVLRSSPQDRATLVAAGVTLHEALQAHQDLLAEDIPVRVIDLYSVKPVDTKTLQEAAAETGTIITVEDHYPEGGLGEAVQSGLNGTPCRFKKLAVSGLPRSGPGEQLMQQFAIGSQAIAAAVRETIDLR